MAKKQMDLNKETAMRLWNKSFGKKTETIDFAGRKIVKGAYNDRNSEFGWNVDHVLPQSRGGKTADHNLVCCHITTNDEKADKFPAFNSNGKKFEILKVENHYEIHQVNKENKVAVEDSVNFMDSASGIRFFKKLKGIQNKKRFVGSILIRLKDVQNTAVIDFIEKFLDEENVSYSKSNEYRNSETRIVATNYNMPLKEDNSKLLDKCILLNTYLKSYFIPMEYVSGYDICYQVNCYDNKQDMYLEAQKINFSDEKSNIVNALFNNGLVYTNKSNIDNALFINKLVYINTEAEEREPNLDFDSNKYCKYDYTYTRLSKNLEKEASKN